jgi:hypothetical protein
VSVFRAYFIRELRRKKLEKQMPLALLEYAP